LEKLGDTARTTKDHGVAIQHYFSALSLDPTNLIDILLKRGEMRAVMGSWPEALIDVDKV
jgi:hypothetical protein